MKTNPSRPTTSSTTNQVLSGRLAVFSTAPIQATKCVTAANNKTTNATPIRPSSVHDRAPDLTPVTSGPFITKMSLLIARAQPTTINTNPATSPMRLPQNSLTINDLVISTTSDSRLVAYVSEVQGPWSSVTQSNAFGYSSLDTDPQDFCKLK